MIINLSLTDDNGNIVSQTKYNLPFGGLWEEEIEEHFNYMIMPVVDALVGTKRQKIDAEVDSDDQE